ncbi:MAG: GreA/GreB family elongation factor [Chloroflexota bacterium]|nr:GreA/GreB family elongation factor [Chloroflexota bacterium]
MNPNSPQTLDEALTRYLPQLKEEGRQEAQVELIRFIQWCGRAKQVQALAPPDVEGYVRSTNAATAESVRRVEAVKVFLAYLGKQKWTATNLAPHVKLPKTRRPATNQGDSRPAPEQAHLTQEGVQQLREQLEQLKEQRVAVVADIQRAMADKDFRENAPLDAAKERQGLIAADIRALEDILARAVVTNNNAEWAPSKEQGRVRPGRRVTVRDLKNDREASYILVDAREADPLAGKLSLTSPVGRALIGRRAGDEVTVTAPSGTLKFRVEKVEG